MKFPFKIRVLSKVASTAILLVVLKIPVLSETTFRIENDIRHDILDYDEDRESLILRNRTTLNLNEYFEFNFSCIRNFSDDSFFYTWYTAASDRQKLFSLILGNYNLNFGSGLVMGRKVYISSDPYSRRLVLSGDSALAANSGGNPVYSFYGAAARITIPVYDIILSAIPFYSIQQRFALTDDADEGKISSSIASINTHISPENNYMEPVFIQNRGLMLSMKAMDLFLIQAYTFDTSLKKDCSDNIAWDYGKDSSLSGTERMIYRGLYISYTDETVSMFIEPAISSRYSEGRTDGMGFMWGASVRNSFLCFYVRSKSTDKDFHAEYSSGSRLPERTWETKATVDFTDKLTAGILFYSERSLVPAYNRSYIGGKNSEEFFIRFSPIKKLSSEFRLRKVKYIEDVESEKEQAMFKIRSSRDTRLHIILNSALQNDDSCFSYFISGEIKYLFSGFFSLQTGALYTAISGENHLYASLPPSSGSLSDGMLFSVTGYGSAIKLKYKKENNSFQVRGSYIETGEKSIKRIEAAAILLF